MPKALKKIGGLLLAVWGVIRALIDFLESLKATQHYTEYLLNSHWYLGFILVPRTIWLTLGLLIVGLGLIFSERLSDIADNWWPRFPNMKCYKASASAITWDGLNSCYLRKADPPKSIFGIWLEIANEVEHGKRSLTAGRVKAQIIFHFKSQELRAAPAAWIDEPCSSVELAPGDTRCLILAAGFHFTQDWRVPLNRRSDTISPPSFEHYDIPGLLGNEGTVEVQLISMQTNKILVTFVFQWQWKPGYPLEIVRLIETKR